jgi:hypothetical protein
METRVASDSDEFDLAHDEAHPPTPDPAPSEGSTPGETRVVTPMDRLTDLAEEDLQQHRKSTVAMPNTASAGESSVAESETHSTHFTTFDEAARQRAILHGTAEDVTPLWLKIAPILAASCLIALAAWYFSRPASEESLYQTIMSVADDGETADLIQVEGKIDQYLERFPQSEHREEVLSLREELSRYRLQKRYERKARSLRSSEDLGPVERGYVLATNLLATDPVAATRQIEALLQVYGQAQLSDADQRCLELAREQLEEMRHQARGWVESELAAITERLDAADRLQADRPQDAAAIRQGVVVLYAEKSWAAAAVARARQTLEDTAPHH